MNISIHWFRQDLRISDNPALFNATKKGSVIPIYILDDINSAESKMGAASRVWLHHALQDLNKSLDGKLRIFSGDPLEIIPQLMQKNNAASIHWNRCYEPWRISRDMKIKEHLQKGDFKVHTYNGSLLWEPWDNLKGDGTPYKIFTPFYKNALKLEAPRLPINDADITSVISGNIKSMSIDDLNLLPNINWHKSIEEYWNISEYSAHNCLQEFLMNKQQNYAKGRDFPEQNITSNLSPYLHFGQISINEVWHKANALNCDENIDRFLTELGWRDFSYSLLYHFPQIKNSNLKKRFDKFPWRHHEDFLAKWKQGQTGYPIIDAGMRELWQTGYMHNRVRMIVASFLVKNLLIHWNEGERWFWDCLVDADHASNGASWQWVAGCGTDASPYFRIFNPVTQGEKFDTIGAYTKKYVPELKKLPQKYIHKPWEAPKGVLLLAGIQLGDDYPKPIVDIKSHEK